MINQAEGTKVSNVRVIESNKSNIYQKSSSSENNICPKQQHFCVDVDSTVLDNCPNTPISPIGINTGVVVKIPVVLSEFTIRFNIGANIRLPEPALEVKDIKKRLKITQCTLLQPTNILFIKGYVRKNIDYTTGSCSNRKGVCGEVHHCTIDVPFECSTPIDFFTLPAPVLLNSKSEFEYRKVTDLPNKYFAEKDSLLSGDMSELNQFMTESFNELPFCELINATIFEFDEFIDRRRPDHDNLPFEERFFSQIEEKMVIEITMKLLQNRQVNIPATVTGI